MSYMLSISSVPKSTTEIVGRDKEITILKNFVQNYATQQKKSLFLCGPSGSGKTSIVQALAEELSYEFFEINASDVRNKDQLQEKLLPALTQQSFFFQGKIILVDEVDGISGTYDRGGVQELVKLCAKSAFPIIFTANDVSHKKIAPLLKKSLILPFDKLSVADTVKILERIKTEKSYSLTPQILKTIAISSDGDIRAAINDVFLLSHSENVEEDLSLLTQRNRTAQMEEVIQILYKTTDGRVAKEALNTLSEDVDKQLLWLEYNTAFEYTKPKDLARAYGVLAKAQVYLSRIRRNQEWRFLVYVFDLLSLGISSAKDEPYMKRTTIKQSSRPLKIWQINMATAKRKVIAQKIAEKTHCSTKRAYNDVDFYKKMIQNPIFATHIQSYLDLEDDEIAWLKK
ncbi:MAG: replication factor C large subunit [Candidatus Woesearchaeota archaeon]